MNDDEIASAGETPPVAMRNEVVLCGRVSMAADERSLPSGDTVLATRVIVDRPSSRRRTTGSGRSRQPVDAIDCVAWSARVRQTIRRWQPGDVVLVTGSIRRRFYRIDGRPMSRVEVEISQARRLLAAASTLSASTLSGSSTGGRAG